MRWISLLEKKLFDGFNAVVARAGRFHLGARVPLLRRIYWFVVPRLKPAQLRMHGMWMEVHKHDVAVAQVLLNAGTYEPFETLLMTGLLADGDVFLDIGANIGYYTLLAARAVGPRGRVVAVEPGRENLRLLRSNIARNGFSNVTVLPMAAGDCAGRLPLYESATNTGDHRLYSVEQRSHYDVEVTRLDEALASLGVSPHVVKIDVQGYEYRAILGLSEVLRSAERCVLCTEFWSEGLRSAGLDDPSRYVALLVDLGFTLYEIDERRQTLESLGDRERLAVFLSDDHDTNLLALKGVDDVVLRRAVTPGFARSATPA